MTEKTKVNWGHAFDVAFDLSIDLFKTMLKGTQAIIRSKTFFIIIYALFTLYVVADGELPVWSLLLGYGFVTFLFGLKDFAEKTKIINFLAKAGFKNTEESKIRVLDFKQVDFNRSSITLKSVGATVDDFKKSSGKIENQFGELVDGIEMGANPQILHINFIKYRLPPLVEFGRFEGKLTKHGQFVIGQSNKGDLIEDITTLPHLLIAGTTGKGKSVFFKQVLYSLLKSTPQVQMYLIDLKKGLEMSDFSELPNVKIAKETHEAINILQAVHKEMMSRFEFLEQKKLKSIDPSRDKKDRIVIGVDEASVLYTLKGGRGNQNDTTKTARDLTDDIAKLGRAAGIHLILATQKVTKETIDTKIQENIGGRICFRVNSYINSQIVLGNKMAYEIPDLPGRAVYSKGTDFVEVQTPLLKESELKDAVSGIVEEFNNEKRKIWGPMLEIEFVDGNNEKTGEHAKKRSVKNNK